MGNDMSLNSLDDLFGSDMIFASPPSLDAPKDSDVFQSKHVEEVTSNSALQTGETENYAQSEGNADQQFPPEATRSAELLTTADETTTTTRTIGMSEGGDEAIPTPSNSSRPVTLYTGFSGTGATGGTGGAGNAELCDTKAKSNSLDLYLGATGAVGMPGTLEEAAKIGMDFNMARKHFKQKVRGKQPAEQADLVRQTWKNVAPKMSKLRSDEAGFAVLLGDMANAMKESIPHGKWTLCVREHFKGLDQRTLQDYQKIATISSVERHLDLGVTKLVKLASLVTKGNLTSEADPIQVILDAAQAKYDYITNDYEMLANVAIANHRLLQAELMVNQAALFGFVESGYSLTNKDIKEMYNMQSASLDPSDHLRAVVKNAGARVFSLTGVVPTDGKRRKAGMPDINTTLQRTSEVINLALGKKDLAPEEIDRALFDKCKLLLATLGKKLYSE